jgi:DNA-binding transcriptional MerR regulator
MAEVLEPIDIPKRVLFKPAEVCELVKVQPYVLRSWETEFPDLGVAKSSGGPRMYRRVDVERVIRIKHLLLVDGLTLAGVRRRLEDESTPVIATDSALEELIGQNARDRLTEVKRGLRAILDILSARPIAEEFQLKPPARDIASSPRSTARARAANSREKRSSSRERPGARRNRSA